MTTTAIDPRPAYAAATEWVQSLLAGITADQFDKPTPCDEFDVRALSQHLHATVLRARALAEVGTVEGQPVRTEEFDAPTFAERRSAALAAWATAPLDREVEVPWGVVPAVAALGMYVNETLVHGWDLAVATGQPAEFPDPEFARIAFEAAQQQLPAQIRELDGVPFGPVVEPRDGAGPTERLANWSGRSAAGWVA
ncbi:TIGR03086 family metal-binding protein [Tsukamurella spumae]|uniref:TIGR03086 family protein n=1 Tax=Tsukamurella spumae TaxID=44753 RepID=A0A846WYZ7_9ACTN|nr:TIGR03086 family metal-binding protein [Tsukamurella spumae]NKY17309.1 TIGR03086 family protein [Tsukamurella spumae]